MTILSHAFLRVFTINQHFLYIISQTFRQLAYVRSQNRSAAQVVGEVLLFSSCPPGP